MAQFPEPDSLSISQISFTQKTESDSVYSEGCSEILDNPIDNFNFEKFSFMETVLMFMAGLSIAALTTLGILIVTMNSP